MNISLVVIHQVATPAASFTAALLESSIVAKHSSHILDMARKGAAHRYEELHAEIAALVRNFPHLGGRKGGVLSRGAAALRQGGKAVLTELAPRKRKLSARARKAISDAQKKRWAKKKADNKK